MPFRTYSVFITFCAFEFFFFKKYKEYLDNVVHMQNKKLNKLYQNSHANQTWLLPQANANFEAPKTIHVNVKF